MLIAGHETTVNLIGNGTLALLQNPDQWERLREDPKLVTPAVEELLGYDGPLETATECYAREDVTIAGSTIPRGERVYVARASANRNEQYFTDPDTLDLTRAEQTPGIRARDSSLLGRHLLDWKGRLLSVRCQSGSPNYGSPLEQRRSNGGIVWYCAE